MVLSSNENITGADAQCPPSTIDDFDDGGRRSRGRTRVSTMGPCKCSGCDSAAERFVSKSKYPPKLKADVVIDKDQVPPETSFITTLQDLNKMENLELTQFAPDVGRSISVAACTAQNSTFVHTADSAIKNGDSASVVPAETGPASARDIACHPATCPVYQVGDYVATRDEAEGAKAMRHWEAWTQEEEVSFFKALRQVGKDFEKITVRVPTKNKDQVRHYYYRTVKRLNKILSPGFALDASKSNDANLAMLRWWTLLEKHGCKWAMLRSKPKRLRNLVTMLERQLRQDKVKASKRTGDERVITINSSLGRPYLSCESVGTEQGAKVASVFGVGSVRESPLRCPAVKFPFDSPKKESGARTCLQRKPVSRGKKAAAALRKWEQAASAGMTLVAEAAAQLEQADFGQMHELVAPSTPESSSQLPPVSSVLHPAQVVSLPACTAATEGKSSEPVTETITAAPHSIFLEHKKDEEVHTAQTMPECRFSRDGPIPDGSSIHLHREAKAVGAKGRGLTSGCVPHAEGAGPKIINIAQKESKQEVAAVGKLKLQLFPVDALTRSALEKDGHNPHLELTLKRQKSMGSVAQHLAAKWVSQGVRSGGQLRLLPFASAGCEALAAGWGRSDVSTTAGDIHLALGCPQVFRLRYAWLQPDPLPETLAMGASSAEALRDVHNNGKTGAAESIQVPKENEASSLVSTVAQSSGVRLQGEKSSPFLDASAGMADVVRDNGQGQKLDLALPSIIPLAVTKTGVEALTNSASSNSLQRRREEALPTWLYEESRDGFGRNAWADQEYATQPSEPAGNDLPRPIPPRGGFRADLAWVDSLTNVSMSDLLGQGDSRGQALSPEDPAGTLLEPILNECTPPGNSSFLSMLLPDQPEPWVPTSAMARCQEDPAGSVPEYTQKGSRDPQEQEQMGDDDIFGSDRVAEGESAQPEGLQCGEYPERQRMPLEMFWSDSLGSMGLPLPSPDIGTSSLPPILPNDSNCLIFGDSTLAALLGKDNLAPTPSSNCNSLEEGAAPADSSRPFMALFPNSTGEPSSEGSDHSGAGPCNSVTLRRKGSLGHRGSKQPLAPGAAPASGKQKGSAAARGGQGPRHTGEPKIPSKRQRQNASLKPTPVLHSMLPGGPGPSEIPRFSAGSGSPAPHPSSSFKFQVAAVQSRRPGF